MINSAIFSAGIASVIFLWYLLVPQWSKFLIILYQSETLTVTGGALIITGLLTSSCASLSLKKSWRIGIDESEKTELITKGIYNLSRNPYFLSYDMVLIGMVFCVLSPFLIASALCTIILFHRLILKEETYLEKQHQDVYREYKERVRRYI